MSIETHSLIQPGKYAVLGFLAVSEKTAQNERDMATTLGKKFGCHSCGSKTYPRYTPDHQPPSSIFTEHPHEYQGNPLYEFEYDGWLFQTTDPSIPQSVGAAATPSTFGKTQFLYPHCKDCSQKQSQVCRKMLK